jgi:hypothetical protein
MNVPHSGMDGVGLMSAVRCAGTGMPVRARWRCPDSRVLARL